MQRIINSSRRLKDAIDVLKEQKMYLHVNVPGEWTVSIDRHRSYEQVCTGGFQNRFVFQNQHGK